MEGLGCQQKLIILTDLWGINDTSMEMLNAYQKKLSELFKVTLYDSCELAQIDSSLQCEKERHAQFISGGIERAVQHLCSIEKDPAHILGLSIGGLIGWRYAIQTDLARSLYGVSSTRLRFEKQKPSGRIHLFFGALDTFIPSNKWFKELNIEHQLIENQGHTCYLNNQFSNLLVSKIKAEFHTPL